jgi:hypothetical protein
MLSPRAAASLLMGKKHLTFIGAESIREHVDFGNDLAALMHGCLLLRTGVEWQYIPGAPPRVVVSSWFKEPVFFVLFAPDTVQNRLATAAIALKYGAGQALCDLASRRVEGPIVMLARRAMATA